MSDPSGRLSLVVPHLALVVAASAGLTVAQTLEDLRQQLREDLRQAHFASGFASLVTLTDDLELSSAHYSFDNPARTRLVTFALPGRIRLSPWDDERVGLYVEGVIGYANAEESSDDLWGGLLPGLATSVATDWRTYGGMAGVGLELQPLDGLRVTPILDLGLAWLQNRTQFGGPGAPVTAALTDGIAFNWDAVAAIQGTALRVDWLRELGAGVTLECVGRYDLRWTETISADDPAQDISARMQLLTLRADVTGPCGIEVFRQPLSWRTTVGYRWFLEGDLFGVDGYLQVGGGLELLTGDDLPLGKGIALTGAALFGHDLSGWTVGVSLNF